MRRALGLREGTPLPVGPAPTRPASNGPVRPHRRFVRDGEVSVEVVHHDGLGTNQLEAARQTIRALSAGRDQAERQLAEAQSTIRDLETKLAHERLARDEATQRAAAVREEIEKALQLAHTGLESESAARRSAEEQLAVALSRVAEAERRVDHRPKPHKPTDAPAGESDVAGSDTKPARRRGRPSKQPEPELEANFVEWWKPGWKEQYR